MGRRPDVEPALDSALYMLTQMSDPRARFLYMYGPRGTGKTVQLNAFRDQCRTRAEPDILLTLTADQVATEEGMRHALFRPRIEMTGVGQDDADADPASDRKDRMDVVRAWLQRWRSSHSDLVRDVPALQPTEVRLSAGFGSVILTLPKQPDRSAGESLLRLGGPVLITLDEAHMVGPDALRILLNAVQEAGERMPVVLALAGTPGLIDRLQEAQASFWDRGLHLPIGRLAAAAARDVIERPLLNAGMTVAPVALARLTGATNFYPFFLQLYGEAAFDAVQESGTGHLDEAECSAAIQGVHESKCRYYERRKWEFMEQPDGLHVGRTIALAFRQHDNHLTTTQVQAELDALDPERTMDRWRFLRHKGYIWDGPVPGSWEPGIPSLMDYMIETTEPDPPTHSTSMI